MNPYTFNPTADGNVEVLKDGQRISTGTADSAKAYGFSGFNPNQSAIGPGFGQPKVTTTPATTPAVVTGATPSMTANETSAQNYLDTFNKPKTEDEIFTEKQLKAQGEVDALNRYYDSLRKEQQMIGEGRERGTNAISVMAGLSGSTEAEGSLNTTKQANARELGKVENERAVAVNSVLSGIRKEAVEQARQSRLDATADANSIVARSKERQTKAIENLKALSITGNATLEGIKSTLSPEEYSYLVNNAGGEVMAKAILFENRPKNSLVGQPTVVGNHVVQYYQKPDGSIVSENVPLPPGVAMKTDNIQSIQKTDQGLFIINKDGTWNKITGSADYRPAPPKVSLSEKKQTAIRDYAEAFTEGSKVGDQPTVVGGFANPVAWKEAMKDAPKNNLSRAEFIQNFGYLLKTDGEGRVLKEYGLTPVEERLIVGGVSTAYSTDNEVVNPFE